MNSMPSCPKTNASRAAPAGGHAFRISDVSNDSRPPQYKRTSGSFPSPCYIRHPLRLREGLDSGCLSIADRRPVYRRGQSASIPSCLSNFVTLRISARRCNALAAARRPSPDGQTQSCSFSGWPIVIRIPMTVRQPGFKSSSLPALPASPATCPQARCYCPVTVEEPSPCARSVTGAVMACLGPLVTQTSPASQSFSSSPAPVNHPLRSRGLEQAGLADEDPLPRSRSASPFTFRSAEVHPSPARHPLTGASPARLMRCATHASSASPIPVSQSSTATPISRTDRSKLVLPDCQRHPQDERRTAIPVLPDDSRHP